MGKKLSDEFKRVWDLHRAVESVGPEYFSTTRPWMKGVRRGDRFVTPGGVLNRENSEEVIIFSTQRSGSTLFASLIRQELAFGNPREHFNHSFRGDHGENISVDRIWQMGRVHDATAHKIMAGDLLLIAEKMGCDSNGKVRLEFLADFFSQNKCGIQYRVQRQSFFDQYLSLCRAQMTNAYFGSAASNQERIPNSIDESLLVDTWLALKISNQILDWFWRMLPENEALFVYERDLSDVSDRRSTLARVAKDLRREIPSESKVRLKPPATAEQRADFRSAILGYLQQQLGKESVLDCFDVDKLSLA